MKKRILLFIIIMLFLSMIYQVYAADESFWEQAKKFLETGATHTGTLDEEVVALQNLGVDTKKGLEKLIDALWGIGLLVVMVGGAILGIKYMFVLPDERSRIKQATTPYVIGTIIIFGALTIWKLFIVVLDGSLQ